MKNIFEKHIVAYCKSPILFIFCWKIYIYFFTGDFFIGSNNKLVKSYNFNIALKYYNRGIL